MEISIICAHEKYAVILNLRSTYNTYFNEKNNNNKNNNYFIHSNKAKSCDLERNQQSKVAPYMALIMLYILTAGRHSRLNCEFSTIKYHVLNCLIARVG